MARISFISLPSEIRLYIYELLLTNHKSDVLSIRTETPLIYDGKKRAKRTRTSYRIMSGRFRAQSFETTYHLLSNPGIHPAILGANKQIHSEASHVLYSFHIFDFDKDIECVIPFLRDLTLPTLSSIKRISIVQRALPYIKDFDRCEWRNVCEFLSRHMELHQLGLGVLGGTPTTPWEAQDLYDKAAFQHIIGFEGMDWVNQLASVKGLRNLDVTAHLEHCPPPQSHAMAFFVNFSASIEKGFAEYLREVMVVGTA